MSDPVGLNVSSVAVASEETESSALERLTVDVIEIVAAVLGVPASSIDVTMSIELSSEDTVHFDSISLTELAARIATHFGIALNPIVFFRYKKLQAFIRYLFETHTEKLLEDYKTKATASDATPLASASEAIAIVGASGRFPGASNLFAFWRNLVDRIDPVTEIPASRWDWRAHRTGAVGDESETQAKWGGFIQRIDRFDPEFFGVPRHEAATMDPSHRLMLETVWELFEDAGYRASDLAGTKTGVFIGAGRMEYDELCRAHGHPIDAQTATAHANSILANRVSYFYDLHGPSEAIDVACASALVALHRAAQAIRSGDCSMAVVGGVHLMLSPAMHISFGRAGVLSSEGQCRTFDAAASGYVRSEGIGTVLLKPLRKAIDDGDNVYAVLRATATNHGGRSNSLTSPNPIAQEALLHDVYVRQGVDPQSIQYVEAHGTGTSFGDSIEVSSLTTAFGKAIEDRAAESKAGTCGIGSVKSNVGHTEEAAGMASLFKVVLAMRHGLIPGNLHFEKLHPYIDLEGSPFFVVDAHRPWPAPEQGMPRRAGINAFGFGGANAHVVVEEFRRARVESDDARPQILVLSARSEKALSVHAARLCEFLEQDVSANVPLTDIVHTLQNGREPMAYRLALVTQSKAEAAKTLAAFARHGRAENLFTGHIGQEATRDTEEPADASKHARIARRWTEGHPVAWPKLAGAARGARVSLPTYPFDGERYWFDDASESDADSASDDLSLAKEREKLLVTWNDTRRAYPRESNLPLLFGAQATRTPHSVAVTCNGRSLTYAELNEASSRIAAHLRANGVARGTHVGIFFDRSIEMLAALLGVLKSGGTYIPLDPMFPAERLGYIVEDTKLGYLLTNRDVATHFPEFRGQVIRVEDALSHPGTADCAATIAPSDVAYVIFTSGSTGKPKGVQVYHRGLTNFLCVMAEQLDLKADTWLLAVTTICFDIAGLELYLPILVGGRVEIMMEEVCRDGLRLKEAIDASAANVLQATPSTWQMLVSSGWCGRRTLRVLCGGENLSRELADELLSRADDVWNLYGPTETTIWSTMAKLEAGREVTLGRPIGNTTIYILNEARELSRLGEAGELCIGGDGVAKEYWNRPELTKDKFIPNPFAAGERLYRTGDVALYRPDGALAYAGRLDNQVKLRGYRIELEEIDSVLQQIRGVAKAVTVVRDGRLGQKSLHAFYSLAEGASTSPERMADYVRQHLPEYMMPSSFVGLMSFPMTLNRKVDRKVLVAMPLDEISRTFGGAVAEEPRTATPSGAPSLPRLHPLANAGAIERAICAAVADLLDVSVDAVDPSSTFATIGLNSVTLTGLRAKLTEALGLTVEPPTLFKHPSIAALSRYLAAAPRAATEQASAAAHEPIAIVGMSGRFPQAEDLGAFFAALLEGKDCIGEMPAGRWDSEDEHGARPPKMWGGFIDDVDKFDAPFFSISPREAQLMDPRQRLLVETVWKTCEDAGYKPTDLSGTKTAVFIGAINSDYWDLQRELGVDLEGYSLSGFANSILPNRISFIFNLLGPSEAVDTACSSSLTAVHRAVASLRRGECDAAFAGGVSVILSPHLYQALTQNGMLSPDGRCKTFDKSANGYVRGEGVGTILLKRLSDARRDGDHVYAVIKGGAVNHGGRANSLTAPNPETQVALLADAYADAGIDRRTVSFVETHGTGTKLGDPIEVESLIRAFSPPDAATEQRREYCGLGALKTNIGHLEAAAGIAGIIKVALAMRARKLPGNLHFNEPNPFIALKGSPFYVVAKTQEWTPIAPNIPLRAGVTSLGFGGASAHLVLEEHHDERPASPRADRVVIALSAKSPERLRAYAAALHAHIRKIDGARANTELESLAYTLQVGRSVMEHRLAYVARSLDEVADGLVAFLAGRSLSNVGDHEEGDPERLAVAWAAGEEVDWSALHRKGRPRRVPLPTYPFERQRHWIARPLRNEIHPPAVGRPLASLIDRNESTLEGVTFTKRFFAEASYLRDHVIGGKRLVPAVVDLEMARTAGDLANESAVVNKLKNVVFRKPLLVEGASRDVSIRLQRSEQGADFKIVGDDASIFAQGRLEYGERKLGTGDAATLDAIRGRCTSTQTREEFYSSFQPLGYDYGATLRPIQRVWKNDREALAEIALPFGAEGADFVLHPSMMEGTLQTLAALLFAEGKGHREAFLPFSIAELEVFGSVPAACYAHVSAVGREASAQSRFNIALLDPSGRLIVSVRDYSVRPVKKGDAGDAKDGIEPALFATKRVPAPGTTVERRTPWTPSDSVVVVSRDPSFVSELRAKWAARGERPAIVWVEPSGPFSESADGTHFEIDERSPGDYDRLLAALRARDQVPATVILARPWAPFGLPIAQSQLESGVFSVMHWSKAFLKERLPAAVFFAYVADDAAPQPLYAALKGFARSLRLESQRVTLRVVEVDRVDRLVDAIDTELTTPEAKDTFVVVRKGARYVEQLEEIAAAPREGSAPITRRSGVYLITGGTGGLGMLVARHFAEKERVRLVLSGRSALSLESERAIAELRVLGAEAEFVRADVCVQRDVEFLRREIVSRYGGVQGIVHCAGELRDQVLSRKTPADFEAVLAPKVFGAMNLDLAFADEKLDFFALFSSIVAFAGNAGQTDYAFGNAFLDAFAGYRNGLCKAGLRSGHTHAFQWPYWKNGGMRVDAQTEAFIREYFGVEPLATATGLRAFDEVVRRKIDGALVMGRASVKTARFLAKTATVAKSAPLTKATETPEATLEAQSNLRERVRAVAAGVLKMRPGEIDNQKDLAGYGYDSISFTELATGINAAFGVELTPAVFFELEPPSIFTIAEYLERSCCVMGESTSAAATAPPEKSALAEAFAPAFAPTDDAIAIIGVSGKMPGAEGLKAFWENLDAGVSSVRTIPSARWAWQDYHGGPKTPNKSVSKCGAFVDDVDRFDAAFFGMTASDARLVDPQQRIVLESVWSAIEDAGYAPATLSNSRTAVYVGVTNRDYLDVLDMAKVGVHATSTFGNEPTFLVNRVSYLLNLHGASEPVNTLCSSSLVAIHKAVAELKSGACHLAIAGGVSVIASPRMDIVFSEAGMLSATGGCRSFAKDADGFVRGEGVGILVLKRLRDAERDGDPIHAIVCATGINHGGHANSPTSPNGKAQVDLVRETYERHDVDPRTIQMLEAHGTGTQLGDAVELNSVTRAFRELCAERGGAVPEQPYCAVTCVKTNIGHLEAAAGIAAVLKAILAIRHRRIPALAAHGEPNSYIDLRNAPFYLATKAEDWRAPTDADGQQLPRRAAVSSFGASGANAHVVIEEYVRAPRAPEKRDGGVHVIALSARDDAALERYASSLRRFVQEAMVTKGSDVRLADIAYTLQTGRAPMSHRLAIVAESLEQLERALSRPIDANHVERRYRGVAATVRDDQSAGALGMDPEAMAQAWVRGEDVGWRERQLEHGVWRIALPTYPFERTRHWAEPPTVKAFDEAHYREVLERLRDGEKSASSILMSATETES